MRKFWPTSIFLGIVIGGTAFTAGWTQSAKGKGGTPFDPKLPIFGTRLEVLPEGPGKEIADRACLSCHSTDILRQQRLSEAQWTASVNKMVGWGAEVPEEEKAKLVKYLALHFGPSNDHFQPVATRPIGR
ncbi:MAG TPA: cytochrome c [Vicinamibacteria bacterium]|jgi:hypothetical protein|nr:cytochrome c [Vicinamibacteria bacterium]